MAPIDRERLISWVKQSCARQGVPVKVTDAAVLQSISALLGGPAGGTARISARGSTVEPAGQSETPNGLDSLDVDLTGT